MSIIVMLFMLHPSITLMTFSLFDCTEVNGVRYLTRDIRSDYQCWSQAHLNWALGLGLPMTAVWVCGIPALGFVLLTRNRRRLDDTAVLGRYRMLYQGLKKEFYFWEFCNTIRKVVLVSINVFVDDQGIKIWAAV